MLMNSLDRIRIMIRWTAIVLLMTITANGWRVVFKVSRSGDVNPAPSVYRLWNGSDVVNDNLAIFSETSRTYMAPSMPTYKSDIVNKWEQSGIQYVKVGLYSGGIERSVVVFNGTGTTKQSWFNSSLVLKSSYKDLSSAAQYAFSLEGSYSSGRFLAMQSVVGTSCSDARGWFMVVDKDMQRYCGNLTDSVPYFVYALNTTSSLFTNGGVADALAVFVDDCVESPCQHQGTCTSYIDKYTCQCIDQVYGQSCQYECPCKHGGICHEVSSRDIQNDGAIVINGTYINNEMMDLDGTKVACRCPQYYVGVDCQNNTLQCASSPCKNYGTCIEGYTSFTCKCQDDYMGDTCQVPRPPVVEEGLNIGAKVAIGVCVPLVIVIGFIIGYLIYMIKNPDAYGHEATYKQYTIAREFVRRSIRRLSGRRGKLNDYTKDTTAISPKEKEVSVGQVNLAFDDGGKVSYNRQTSEYYNMSADDNAVITGTSSKYPVGPGINRGYQNSNGISPSQFANNGHRYDDYTNPENPVPQPRKQRQTGRRGRQATIDGTDEQDDRLPYQSDPYNTTVTQKTPQQQTTERGRYDGHILPTPSRGGNIHPGVDHPDQRPYTQYPQDKAYLSGTEHTNRGRYPQYSDEKQQQTSHLSPGYLTPHNNSTNDSRRTPGPRFPYLVEDSRRSPAYPDRSDGDTTHFQHPQSTPSRLHGTDQRHPDYTSRPAHGTEARFPPDQRQPDYTSRQPQDYNQRSPRSPVDYNRPYDRYQEQENYSTGQRSDDRIVFTSSEPMDDVTV